MAIGSRLISRLKRMLSPETVVLTVPVMRPAVLASWTSCQISLVTSYGY
jgi:hypothetical protein